MSKTKKIVIWVLVAALVIGGSVGGYGYYRQNNRKPVYVFSFYEGMIGMPDYQGGGSESGGMVRTDQLQPVFLSSTQTVLDVLVQEGQEVKKGDVLFTYDTTLSDIALQQKDLSIQQAKLDLDTAYWELAVINSYVPISYHPVPEPEPPEEPVADLKEFDLKDLKYLAYSGSGKSSLTPKYVWFRSDTMIDDLIIQDLFRDSKTDVLFVRCQFTENDTNDGAFTEEYGLKLMRLNTAAENQEPVYTYRFAFFNPFTQSDEPVDDGVDINSGYTAEQIYSMRLQKEEEIKGREFDIKVAESEFSIMQKEADSGEVTAQFDGVVISMQDPEFAAKENQPFMKVSGGGGFYITGTVSELDLATIQLGQKVSVSSWDTMQTYEGEIIDIQQFPEENEGYYRGGQNLSYYPFTIFVDESADLQDGYYVSVTLQEISDMGKLYVSNAFLRTEGASSYVYVRGENNLLEKRKIQVGGSLWGSYTEVVSGLTADDWLAFPYGNDVKPGAPTQEGTAENLYGM